MLHCICMMLIFPSLDFIVVKSSRENIAIDIPIHDKRKQKPKPKQKSPKTIVKTHAIDETKILDM